MKACAAFLVIGGAMVAFTGCADDSSGSGEATESSPPESATATVESSPAESTIAAEQVPDPQQLAAMLVAEDDLDGDWSVNPWGLPPTDQGSIGFGEARFAMHVCDDASEDFKAAEAALHWQAIVHLDNPEAGVSTQELLWADESAGVEAMYTRLEEGFDACMGSIDTDDTARIVTRESLTVPEVGDERTGVLIRIEEPGGESWILHGALVRDGPVLMYGRMAMTGDGDDVESEFEQVIRTMAAKIA